MNRHRDIAFRMKRAAPEDVITDGLVMRHVFQDAPLDQVTDLSGNGNHLTPVNILESQYVTGRLQDYAINWPSEQWRRMTSPWQPTEAALANGISLVTWLGRWQENTSDPAYKCSGIWYSSSHRLCIGQFHNVSPPTIRARFGTGLVDYSMPIAQNWRCVAFRASEPEGIELFIDGEFKALGTKPLNYIWSNLEYTIGRGESNSSYAFDNTMDEHRIYNRRLTDQEMLAIANDQG